MSSAGAEFMEVDDTGGGDLCLHVFEKMERALKMKLYLLTKKKIKFNHRRRCRCDQHHHDHDHHRHRHRVIIIIVIVITIIYNLKINIDKSWHGIIDCLELCPRNHDDVNQPSFGLSILI